MKLFNLKNKKGFTPTLTLGKDKSKLVSGFTLIEMLIAVFVLTIALSALLNLISTTLFSSRYANNEIIANYLMQEAADYIRNDRDTKVLQPANPISGLWSDFLSIYQSGGCFSPEGCQFEVNPFDYLVQCDWEGYTFGSSQCRTFGYDENTSISNRFYTYHDDASARSNFKRQIKMYLGNEGNDQNVLNVTITVEWLNGTVVKSRSMNFTLTNWQPTGV